MKQDLCNLCYAGLWAFLEDTGLHDATKVLQVSTSRLSMEAAPVRSFLHTRQYLLARHQSCGRQLCQIRSMHSAVTVAAWDPSHSVTLTWPLCMPPCNLNSQQHLTKAHALQKLQDSSNQLLGNWQQLLEAQEQSKLRELKGREVRGCNGFIRSETCGW